MKFLFIIRSVKNNIAGTPLHIFPNFQQLLAVGICRGFLPWEIAAAICRDVLPQLFAVGICRSYLPQPFAVRICHGYLPWLCFVYVNRPFCVSKSFFLVSESFLIESKPFLYVSNAFFIYEKFFINSVSFCYCRGCYWPPQKRAFKVFRLNKNIFHYL